MAVHGAPSSCSNRISFKATKLSVRRDFPLNTVAYVPYKNNTFITLPTKQMLHTVTCIISNFQFQGYSQLAKRKNEHRTTGRIMGKRNTHLTTLSMPALFAFTSQN